jgi:putative membrane protein
MPNEPPVETVRLHQANERTLLAWIRTAISIMAFGFAIARFGVFLRQVAVLSPAILRTPTGLESTWVGAALVAIGVVANVLATVNYARVRRSIEAGHVGAPSALLAYGLGVTAALLGLGMAVLLLRSIGN